MRVTLAVTPHQDHLGPVTMSEYQISHCVCLIHLLEPGKTFYLVKIVKVFSGPSVRQAPQYEVQTWVFPALQKYIH